MCSNMPIQDRANRRCVICRHRTGEFLFTQAGLWSNSTPQIRHRPDSLKLKRRPPMPPSSCSLGRLRRIGHRRPATGAARQSEIPPAVGDRLAQSQTGGTGVPGITGDLLLVQQTSYGLLVIGGYGPNTYDLDKGAA